MSDPHLILAVLHHAEVSRAMSNSRPRTPALNLLIRARRARSQHLAARRNAREDRAEAAAIERRYGAGSAYEAGYSVGAPDGAQIAVGCVRRIREALEAEGLPDDLRALCEAALAE